VGKPHVASAALVLAACQTLTGTWGPMAVIDADTSVVVQVAGGTGSIVINATCVFLARDGGPPVTLVWRKGEVTWTGSSIQFSNVEVPRSPPVNLRMGTRVLVGGEPTDRPRWVSPPRDECPPERFTVHEVVLQ
jgi:hypothetical protein